MDFSKAYDRISREHLWFKLMQIGIHGRIFDSIKALYNNVKCSVCINSSMSEQFSVNCGLKQGCLISPLAFNLFINDLV